MQSMRVLINVTFQLWMNQMYVKPLKEYFCVELQIWEIYFFERPH